MIPRKVQVGVIGAGMSGLICALECQSKGLETVILESSHKVGGRLQSEIIQGAICDRGFQVFLPSYPKARKWVKSLNIKWCPYPRSAQIIDQNSLWFGIPYLTPKKYQIGEKLKPTLGDYIQLSKDCLDGFFFKNRGNKNVQLETYFTQFYSKNFSKNFLKPFFRGVFLDKDLQAPIPLFQYYLNLFLRGGVSVPENGMGEITHKLALSLQKNSLFLNQKVHKIISNRNGWLIKTHLGEELQTDVVVLATEYLQACQIYPQLCNTSRSLPLSTHFCLTKSVPEKLGPLNLFPNAKSIHGIAIPTTVAPNYTTGNSHLLMLTTHGLKHSVKEDIIEELIQLGISEAKQWNWIHQLPIKQIIPKFNIAKIKFPNFILAGDWTTFPSIEGACRSGEDAGKKSYKYILNKCK